MPELLVYACSDLTLQEALASCAGTLAGAVGIVYRPGACAFARCDGTPALRQFAEGAEVPVPLTDAFEARVFTSAVELRWLQDHDGRGRAALVTETELPVQGWRLIRTPVLECMDSRYLLWGQGTGEQPHAAWSALATGRIGTLYVPGLGRSVSRQETVALKTREYVADQTGEGTQFPDGNCAVIDERLVSLEVVTCPMDGSN